jgi:hypothetical protein
MMFDPQEDPLALGLKQRAREQRLGNWAQNPSMAPLHSALGDDWDAWFQAANEATGGMPLKFAAAGDASSPVDPNADAGTLFAAHSNQLRGASPMSSMNALRKLGRTK